MSTTIILAGSALILILLLAAVLKLKVEKDDLKKDVDRLKDAVEGRGFRNIRMSLPYTVDRNKEHIDRLHKRVEDIIDDFEDKIRGLENRLRKNRGRDSNLMDLISELAKKHDLTVSYVPKKTSHYALKEKEDEEERD